jgi:hypothetical protein
MEIHEQHGDPASDGDVTACRVRAREMLDEIAEQARQALEERGIDVGLFFLVPSSGPIVIFGTLLDPDDVAWHWVGEIVGSIVAGLIGLDGVRCREVACAATDSVADPQPLQARADWTSSNCATLSPTSAQQYTEADR